ncbi:MAG: hypothetical protein WC804_11625 [Sphingomonas sp.]|jgi:hypothetical protein|uniref:hypothetical protein n=1 Tax=Sphingomonas sp. TaxID=28214 RepID=UPI003565124D
MILRTIVLIVAAIAFVGALAGTLVDTGVWPSLVASGVLLFGIAFERVRYGAAQRRPAGDSWQETPERFIDDETGRPVTVWFNPASGERRYVDSSDPSTLNALANELQR